jgi:hypothetical protein
MEDIMKQRSFVLTSSAVALVCASLLVSRQAQANQTVYHSYRFSWPNYPLGYNIRDTARCNTGAPDYDSSCVSGDFVTYQWSYNTGGPTYAQMSVYSKQIRSGDHYWCNVTIYCTDGETLSESVVDGNCPQLKCGWGQASEIDVGFGLTTNPS